MSGSLSNKEKLEVNTQILKTLLKLPENKYCSDCKRNDHPRWASWSLGVFLCIRCSGIHRSMGTHISRVKSVDLDSWTNEQLENMIKWGNGRANKYWEAKLIPGHIPSESKIENYIRTKYEIKRWVMDGPIPDPSSLDNNYDETSSGLLNSDVSEKDLTSMSKDLIPQVHTKNQQIPDNLFVFLGKENLSTSHNQGLSVQQSSVKSKESSFLLNSNNSTNIPKSHLLSQETQVKTSKADLKTSILSLYSAALASQSDHSTNCSIIDASLQETKPSLEYKSDSSNPITKISENLKNSSISEKNEIFNPSESCEFSNPAVSYLNTQKVASTSESFDVLATKDQPSTTDHKYLKNFKSDIVSTNIFQTESLHKNVIAKSSEAFVDSNKDPSFKQWDNDSLSFGNFQSSMPLFPALDTLSFHPSPWSDKSKETNNDSTKETTQDHSTSQTSTISPDLQDKNVFFYDNSIISTTDVWK